MKLLIQKCEQILRRDLKARCFVLFFKITAQLQGSWKTQSTKASHLKPSFHRVLTTVSQLDYLHLFAAKSLQLCPTLCDPIDGSPLGSSVPGVLQARILEWVAISFSNARKWKVKMKSLSRPRLLATPRTAAYQAPPSMGFSRQEYWSGVPKCIKNTGRRADRGRLVWEQPWETHAATPSVKQLPKKSAYRSFRDASCNETLVSDMHSRV